jgi:CRISPR-associated endonuclease Csn1
MKDLELAFDVGHSSIGWAVLQANPQVEIKGCGAVIFRPDDCLASARRGYRRQRRHIRSTRQRIKRMKALLMYLGVLSEDQLNRPGCAWPWKLAARALVGGKTLTWPELWDVLRWYAHNRGYDANRRWSAAEAEAEKEDTEKLKNAKTLLDKHGVETMAETFCKELGVDPLGTKSSSMTRFKGLNAAFPRGVVEAEVARILQAHFGKLKGVDEKFATALFSDRQAIPCPDINLPQRYQGGLLFGQLVPRFDNRIISTCPITGQKVPSRNTTEFLNFRWGMLLANVRVARLADRELKPLTPEERKELDKRMRAVGSMTEKQFKDAVRAVSGAIRGNFDTMFMEVNQKEALILDPVQDRLSSGYAASLFPTLPERIQKRARGQLRRGKALKLGELGNDVAAFDAEVQRILDKAAGKGRKKDKALTREAILGEQLKVKKLSGRAAYSRPILRKAFEEVMAGKHPTEDGCLFVTEQMRQAQLNRSLAEQTNNHLVRHRLLILERLLRDIIKEYAAGDKARIEKVTIEVNRDLQEFSGLDVQGKAKLQGLKLSNHKKVSEKLEAVLKANNRLDAMSASLIRKARIADDLGCVCPYVGPKKPFEMIDLVNKRVDLDHIVPKTERQSDSLDSLVVTYSEINKWKGKRTAWQFVRDEQGKQVPGRPDLSIQSLVHYEEFVNSLPPHRDPFKRQTGNGERRFLDDDKRRWRRKKLLLLTEYTEKIFTPRDLTQTSQITRLAQQTILKRLDHLAPHNVIPIPGSLTGLVRKAWEILGCLNLACPQAEGRNKTEIRDITHLHHALDACVLGLTSHFIPNDGHVWELIGKRSLNPVECRELGMLGIFDFNDKGLFRLRDLDKGIKQQIRQGLAEKRVVQHIPKRMTGLRVEQNTWHVVEVKGDEAVIRQRIRQPDGKRPPKETTERITKLLGLNPPNGAGKLKAVKGALVIPDNFGIALDPKPTVIPFHKVWPRLQTLKVANGGKMPRVLRNGQLIQVPQGRYKGVWRVVSAKNNKSGMALDMGWPDVVRLKNGTEGHKINVLLVSLLKDGMTILDSPLTGVASTA